MRTRSTRRISRGAWRNPWIFEQATDVAAGRQPRAITHEERAKFLLEYIDLLVSERVNEAHGFRHLAPTIESAAPAPARGRERWVINKLRALNAWYTKGIDNGSHLRVAINCADSIPHLREVID